MFETYGYTNHKTNFFEVFVLYNVSRIIYEIIFVVTVFPSYVTLKVILKLLLPFTVTPTVTLCQEQSPVDFILLHN